MFVRRSHRAAALIVAVLMMRSTGVASAQDPLTPPQSTAPIATPAIDALLAEIRRLQLAIDALRTDLTESRSETAAVKEALANLRAELDEERELLASQLGTIEQAKVESGSKYRVRLFGMALMQLVSTRGGVDNIDLPILAIESTPGDSGGNISAAVRQSFIGIAVFGPTFLGMETSGDLRLDFFGGFPDAIDGLSAPGLRLRTMAFALEGKRFSIRTGQEAPFFSPYSPSSLAATAYPALSSAGNIWSWTPQIYVERRFERSPDTTWTLRTGVLDALTGELPAGEYSRFATAGERSRAPAPAAHAAWRRSRNERVTGFGTGVYYSRQNWGYDRVVNAWAITSDWDVPLWPRINLLGEIYAGQAIGGLGGGAHSSVLFEGSPADPAAVVHPLHSAGGWAQLKFSVTPRLDINVAAGGDRSKPRPFDGLLEPPRDEAPSASRNANAFANVMYQARSNLFFSVEYRRLWTRRFDGRAWLADHLNFGGAIAF